MKKVIVIIMMILTSLILITGCETSFTEGEKIMARMGCGSGCDTMRQILIENNLLPSNVTRNSNSYNECLNHCEERWRNI